MAINRQPDVDAMDGKVPRNVILHGHVLDVLRSLPDEQVHCVVTSPPYLGLRDYQIAPVVWGGDSMCGHTWGVVHARHDIREAACVGKTRTTDRFYGDGSRRFDGNHQKHTEGAFCLSCNAWRGCLGQEPTIALYIAHMVEIFREVRRVLRLDGTCWLNIGDSFANDAKWGGSTSGIHARDLHGVSGVGRTRRDTGLKPKDQMLIPFRLAIALQDDGWWVRSDIVWDKPNAMPESVTDRPTRAHEYILLLTKRARYYYDAEGVKEPVTGGAHARGAGVTRNKRSVWRVASHPFVGAHFATFPPTLVDPCIVAGTSPQACKACGSPWRRVVQIAREADRRSGRNAMRGAGHFRETVGGPANRPGREFLRIAGAHTIGWQPTCRCQQGTGSERSVVLDPFMGAGTVGLVAAHRGRDYLGIEIKAEYVALAKARIADELARMPHAQTISHPTRRGSRDSSCAAQLSLNW